MSPARCSFSLKRYAIMFPLFARLVNANVCVASIIILVTRSNKVRITACGKPCITA